MLVVASFLIADSIVLHFRLFLPQKFFSIPGALAVRIHSYSFIISQDLIDTQNNSFACFPSAVVFYLVTLLHNTVTARHVPLQTPSKLLYS
jgi:hypothetical protein